MKIGNLLQAINSHINSLDLIKERTTITITGQVRGIKTYGTMVIYDVSDSTGKIKCKSFNIELEENKIYELIGSIHNGRYGIEFSVKSAVLLETKKSKTEKLYQYCIENKLFENKKQIDFSKIRNITILSKQNTQGYSDFINQLQIPIHVNCISVCLEGPNTSPDIINKIDELQTQDDIDIIMIMRGGGDTTEISLSFDTIELFQAIKKSSIPIVTSIGHFNDSDKKLLITKVSDYDFPTPTSAAQQIRKNISNTIYSHYNNNKEYYYSFFHELVQKCDNIHYEHIRQLTSELEESVSALKNSLKKNITQVTYINDPGDEFCIKRDGKFLKCKLVIDHEIEYNEEQFNDIDKISLDNLPKASKYELFNTDIQLIRKQKNYINRLIKQYQNLAPILRISKKELPNMSYTNVDNITINNYKKIKQYCLYNLNEINQIDKLEKQTIDLSYNDFVKLCKNEYFSQYYSADILKMYKLASL